VCVFVERGRLFRGVNAATLGIVRPTPSLLIAAAIFLIFVPTFWKTSLIIVGFVEEVVVHGRTVSLMLQMSLGHDMTDLLNAPQLEQIQLLLRLVFLHDEEELCRLLCCQVTSQTLKAQLHLPALLEELLFLLK
jgi:hypothetical protein